MKILRECPIGCLSWFGGVFWLAIAYVSHLLSKVLFKVRLYRLAWVFINLTMKANRMALKCAIEGGAEVEDE